MKHSVKKPKTLAKALKEIEPFIRNPEHIWTGKPFENFGGMRPREFLANWLLCVAANAVMDANFTFSSDPLGGDGIIVDDNSKETHPTEHVIVRRHKFDDSEDAQTLILDAINKKREKGDDAYAEGKTLVVFLEGGSGTWHPNRVAEAMPQPIRFAAVWVVALQGVYDGEYVYGVTQLHPIVENVPIITVRIHQGFDGWSVKKIQ